MNKFWIAILVLITASCIKENVEIDFIEIKDNISRFEIVNNTDSDLGKIAFEITFLDKNDSPLLIDTITYQAHNNQNGETPFLLANDKTFIVQAIPDGCKKTDIRILEVVYFNKH